MSPTRGNLIYVVIFLNLHGLYCDDPERFFSWKDYNGTLSVGVIKGGHNANGTTYIGQVYVEGMGLLVGEILPEEQTAVVADPLGGKVIKVNSSVKILTGPLSSWIWSSQSSNKLHVSLICQYAVVGGYLYDNSENYINVGKTSFNNEVKIRSIASYQMDTAVVLTSIVIIILDKEDNLF